MKASIIFLLVLCGLTTGLSVIRDHIFVNIPKNWTDAQSYCREHHTDLSTVQSLEEQKILLKLHGANVLSAWFGLYRDNTNIDHFLWCDGDVFEFTYWGQDQPNNINGEEYCVFTHYGWYDRACYIVYPFFCYNSIFLIKEKMTWEEAQEYCRVHHTDLTSLPTETQLQVIKLGTLDAQTDSVWTGLRFLAGEWFWVDGKPLGDQVHLPACPVHPARCGARNTKTEEWENRDCEERLNFLCT